MDSDKFSQILTEFWQNSDRSKIRMVRSLAHRTFSPWASRRTSRASRAVPEAPLRGLHWLVAGWKGSMGERPNHSNFWTIRIFSKFYQNSGEFVRIHQNMWNLKNLTDFLENAAKFREIFIRIGEKINENYVYLQRLVPIQRRTSPRKFDDLAEKSE